MEVSEIKKTPGAAQEGIHHTLLKKEGLIVFEGGCGERKNFFRSAFDH